MEQETTNQPEPRPAPVILRAKPLRVEANFRMSARLASASKPPKPPVKPPGPPTGKWRGWGKEALKEIVRAAIRKAVDWVSENWESILEAVAKFLQRHRRQPAAAAQV